MTAKKILLVDDDAEIIESVRYALETESYDVVIARDGNEAVALAESEMPDIMILDMMMPKMSGFLVLEHLLRQSESSPPVIMITGNEGNRHQAYAELLGVSEYLHKPFAMDQLLASVDRLLD
ncbi:MAG: response regulator transcription factor [Planctomycetota bacterium]